MTPRKPRVVPVTDKDVLRALYVLRQACASDAEVAVARRVLKIADGKAVDHGSLIFTSEGMKQYVEFFRGSLAGGHATIVNPYAR